MSDNLDTLSDAELSEAFAVECAGFVDEPNFPHMFWLGPDGCMEAKQTEDGEPVDFFATSADAVIPLIERFELFPEIMRPWHDLTTRGADAKRVWEVRFDDVYATAPTLARALAVALLRWKRAEKGQP